MTLTVTEIVFCLIAAPMVAYVLARAAALGWYGVKERYTRRLIDGIRRGEKANGKSTG